MFGLCMPSHEIVLVKQNNENESVSICDLSSEKQLKEHLNYLFDKCNYKKEKYKSAIYQDFKGRVLMQIDFN